MPDDLFNRWSGRALIFALLAYAGFMVTRPADGCAVVATADVTAAMEHRSGALYRCPDGSEYWR